METRAPEKRKASARLKPDEAQAAAATPPAKKTKVRKIHARSSLGKDAQDHDSDHASPGPGSKLNKDSPLPTRPRSTSPIDAKSLQSIAESGVLASSLARSRSRWISPGIFERYWTKPKTVKGVVHEPPKNPGKDTMQKLGRCRITIEPHVFDATLFTIKAPPKPVPAVQPSASAQDRPANSAAPAATLPAPSPSVPIQPRTPQPATSGPSQAPPQQTGQAEQGQATPLATTQQAPTSQPSAQPSQQTSAPSAPVPVESPSQPVKPEAPPADAPTEQEDSIPKSGAPPSAQPGSTQAGPTEPARPVKPDHPTQPSQSSPSTQPTQTTNAAQTSQPGQISQPPPTVQPAQAPQTQPQQSQPSKAQVPQTVPAQPQRQPLQTPQQAQAQQPLPPIPKPVPGQDPVILMLAQRASTDANLKVLMKIVASGSATKDQLAVFQGHIDELQAILLRHNQARAAQQSMPAQVPNRAPAPPIQRPGPTYQQPYNKPMTFAYNSAPHPPPKIKAQPPVRLDISGVCIEFDAASISERLLFPRQSIVEYLPGGLAAKASFLAIRRGDGTQPDFEIGKSYYEPVTISVTADLPRVLEPLGRAVAPADEVRKQMAETMAKMTRAPRAELVLRTASAADDGATEAVSTPAALDRRMNLKTLPASMLTPTGRRKKVHDDFEQNCRYCFAPVPAEQARDADGMFVCRPCETLRIQNGVALPPGAEAMRRRMPMHAARGPKALSFTA